MKKERKPINKKLLALNILTIFCAIALAVLKCLVSLDIFYLPEFAEHFMTCGFMLLLYANGRINKFQHIGWILFIASLDFISGLIDLMPLIF